MIDLQRLRVLRAVADQGSFNRAAVTLRLTPSAVSQHIATLERSLGTLVVERSARGVALTEAGRIMLGASESIAAELAHARRQVDRLGSGRHHLTLATFTSGGRHLLPGALRRTAATHADTVLHVREAEPEESLGLLRDGTVQIALAYHFDGPLPGWPSRPGMEWIPLVQDPLHVVLPDGHPMAGGGALDISELAHEPWVIGCLKTEAFLRRHAERAGFVPEIRGTTTDYFFACTLVAAGVGVSLIPSVGLAAEVPGVQMVPIAPPTPTRHIGIAVPSRRGHPSVTTMVEALQEQAGRSVGSRAG